MLKRKRKYRCSHCKQILYRISDKQWIESYCEEKGIIVRLQLIKK